MSLFWAVRLGLLATLFAIVGLAWLLLSNRQKYEKRLESTRLAIPLLSGNVDGMLVFPLVFLANGCEAIVEERYDVGVRFRAEYQRYRYRTWMFGPPWFWLALGGVLVAVLTVGSMG